VLYRLLADLTLVIHLAFIAFVLLGALAVLRWPRLAWLHLPALAWGVVVEAAGWRCPLTPLEVWLRRAAGDSGYPGGFIEHYLLAVLYPAGLTRELQWLLVALLLALNAALYALVWRARRRARRGDGEPPASGTGGLLAPGSALPPSGSPRRPGRVWPSRNPGAGHDRGPAQGVALPLLRGREQGGVTMAEFDFSTGYRWVDAAFGEGSDTTPVIAQMHEFAMRYTRTPGRVFYTDPEKFVRGVLVTARDFGFDVPSHIWDVYNIEAEALGLKLALFDDTAPAIDNSVPRIRSERDLLRLRPPDPERSARMPFARDVIALFGELTGRAMPPAFCSPFTLASHLLTFEHLVLEMRDHPGFVHRVMSWLVDEVLAPYLAYLARCFPSAPLMDGSDAVASLPFITEDLLEEFALGYLERLQRQCPIQVVNDNWWGDRFAADRERFWRQKMRACPPYFKIQDPDLFAIGLDAPLAFARSIERPIVLGVDNLVLQDGDREAITRRVHEYLEAAEGYPRSCLYLCSLSAATPEDNVRHAIEAVRRFRAGDRPYAGQRQAGQEGQRERPPAGGEEDGAAARRGPARIAVPGVAGSNREAIEERLDAIYDAVLELADERVVSLCEQALAEGVEVGEILDEALIAAMDEVGEQFSSGTLFVPEMLLAARAMKAGLAVLRPVLTRSAARPRGTVMLATVQGDVHDIGKNLVGMMLEGAGYRVIDLGVNQGPEEIIAGAERSGADVIALSALLTTTMPAMGRIVGAAREHGLPQPIVIGGAPVNQAFCEAIGADGYGESAPAAVELVQRLVAARPSAARPG